MQCWDPFSCAVLCVSANLTCSLRTLRETSRNTEVPFSPPYFLRLQPPVYMQDRFSVEMEAKEMHLGWLLFPLQKW